MVCFGAEGGGGGGGGAEDVPPLCFCFACFPPEGSDSFPAHAPILLGWQGEGGVLCSLK